MTQQTCAACNTAFEITENDRAYYEKIDVPLPRLCPKDRLKRRLAFRNERTLYKRKCDKTGQDIVSNFKSDAPVPVYYTADWFKDDWTPPSLPKYDFSKPFLEQIKSLWNVAPRMHKATGGNEVNSEYTNHSGNCKNCYYTFNSEYNEDCMYVRFADHASDCMDCTNVLNSELCYECVNIDHGYRLFFSDDCKNCRDSAFLRYCRRVNNSLFCYGLEGKEYNIFNQQYTKDDFFKKIRELELNTYSGQQRAIKQWEEWATQFPRIREVLINCENSTGNSLFNCKNAHDCYTCKDLEDCRYILNTVRVKDSYDFYAYGEAELAYECVTMMGNYNVKFCVNVLQSDNIEYSDNLRNCHYCFGCVGLHGKSYCIFNKQYTKEEYDNLVPRIREHMKQTHEYGEFFPVEVSYFSYEDTLAQDYFPVTEKIIKPAEGTCEQVSSLPDNIADLNSIDEIANKTYLCPETGKLFRFQKKELEFYKKLAIPLPHASFEARYKRRNTLIPFPY